jgi:hypothetical protein
LQLFHIPYLQVARPFFRAKQKKKPFPSNDHEVRSFLSACQTMRKFIASFSINATLLQSLPLGSKAFLWGKEKEEAFQPLNTSMGQHHQMTMK